VAETLRGRNVFDYETVDDVIVVCTPDKAPIIAERDWFPDQEVSSLPDGSVELRFPQVPRPLLIRWILSYAGHLMLLQPRPLQEEIRRAARLLLSGHPQDDEQEQARIA
jgi:predicted DNA-binding transcriptional regulator YafY